MPPIVGPGAGEVGSDFIPGKSPRDIVRRVMIPRFLRADRPDMPVVGIMRVVGESLPVSIDDIMTKYFKGL